MHSKSTGTGRLIDTLALPQGLKSLNVKQLEQVASELREEMIDSVSTTGGHFASSLGALEIAVVLHHLFDTPRDRIVWDVGHQAYAHKMLTGRREKFSTIRKKGGLSGFLKRAESEFDCYGAGHAGTAISAAVGMSAALSRTDPSRKVIAVVGDASIASGMAFEGLNHAGDLELNNLIVLLNDNKMSISPNVGAISRLLSSALTSETSTRLRARLKRLFRGGYMPEVLYKAVDRAEEVTQGFFSGASMLFEAFGFRYIGPIDGHNVSALIRALNHARRQDRPVLVHAHTLKGKGYIPAERDPVTWHGVSPFDRGKGEFISGKTPASECKTITYTQVFGDTLLSLAKKDRKIIGITAAMSGGTGLDKLETELPESFYDVGICEEHAVTFASGLACEGFKPVCAIYSSFLQRAYDQVAHDVCLQNLPVVFAIDRAGLVGPDGETHQGVYDITYLRSFPNMVLMSPKDENELRHMLFTALSHNGPVAIRYPRGYGNGVKLDSRLNRIPIGKAEVLQYGSDVLLVCFGPVVKYALKAAEKLLKEYKISCTIVNSRFARPLDTELLSAQIPRHQLVCTLEDHAVTAGFGSAVLELINSNGLALQNPVKCFGMGDEYVPHATLEEQHRMCEFDTDSIFNHVLMQLKPVSMAATA